jgi:hypothetical protein
VPVAAVVVAAVVASGEGEDMGIWGLPWCIVAALKYPCHLTGSC